MGKLKQAQSTPELFRRLSDEPTSFEPTTAIRVAASVGDGLMVQAHTGVAPAAAVVDRVHYDGKKVVIRSVLAGLVGTLGALPPMYSELVLRQRRNRSYSLSAFLDIFGQRIVELFVEANEKYRLARLLRWQGINNAIDQLIFALVGFGTLRLRHQNSVGDDMLMRFAGFFVNRTRDASALRAMLSEFLGLKVEIEEFRGRWITISPSEQSQMGQPVLLGRNAMAGSAIRDFAGGFRVVVGPVGYEDYLALTPGTPHVAKLFALTRLFVGQALDFDVQVILKKEEVPFCKFGEGENPPRLGWNSWARSEALQSDARDAVITWKSLTKHASATQQQDSAICA